MLHRLTALLTRLAYWILAALADFGEHKLIPIIETDVLPDFLLRFGIRLLLKKKLRDIGASDPVSARFRKQREFVRRCANTERLALKTDQANEQHYEIPAAWYNLCLGEYRKYSAGIWHDPYKQSQLITLQELSESERMALELVCERARLQDGQHVLELGCGWGSLSLFMAEKYPSSKITAVSNSSSQKVYIDAQARERGLRNLVVITSDVNDLELDEAFDRAVSVEMFEHVQDVEGLLERIHRWLKPDGLLFVHIFTHAHTPYFMDDEEDSWMTEHFFSGGNFKFADYFLHTQEHFRVAERWAVDGMHYAKTCEAWLQRMDQHKPVALKLLASIYGKPHATTWWVRWRLFYLSCAELFKFNNGQEWFVTHTLLQNRR